MNGQNNNALPEYKVRTMKDDLASATPENLPIKEEEEEITGPEPQKAPLPNVEELVMEKPPIPLPPIPSPPPTPAPKIEAVPKKERKSKFFIILIIIIIIAIAIAAFFYWQGTKPEPPPNQSPQNGAPQTPQSLIPVKETKIISIENNILLLTYLINQTKLEQVAGTFKSIIPQKEDKKLSLNELVKELNIVIYPYVLSGLKDNYSLVLYNSQNNKKRLGLIIEINNSNTIKEQLRFWEGTMVEDLKKMLLDKPPADSISKNFLDDTYKGTAIRYINLPNPDLTVNYTIKNNLLILCTSKEIMYKIIDRIE